MSLLIPPEDFLNRKDIYQLDETIKTKYTELFNKYECFSKMTYFHRATNKVIEKKKHIPSTERKNSKKSFTSLWNILNESNYAKIAHRLKFMVTKENVDSVVREIVKMSIMHSIYRKYFLLILKDILDMYDANAVLQESINTFSGDYFIYTPSSNVSCEYDIFCKMQKHKVMVLNTVSFLIDIIDNNEKFRNIDVSASGLIDNLFEAFKPHLLDEYYLDLFINAMIIIASKHKEDVCTKIMENSIHWQEMLKSNTSKKIEFLIEKIFNITKMTA